MKNLIGNTPLLKIVYEYKGEERVLFAKAEYYNFTGSIKDRMANYIMERSYVDGTLRPGQTIVEATSGNTGISFSALGALFNHPVHIFMPDWMSKERKNMITRHGAILHEVTKEQGGFLGSIRLADEYAEEIGGFRPQQFSNKYNTEAHYATTGPEIIAQLQDYGVIADGLVAGVGTGRTIMGVGNSLRLVNPNVKLFPLEPENSPTLTTGHKVGKHRIQGISDEFIPELCKLEELDEIIMVDDGDSVIMAQKLATELGLGVGISSGANFIGAVIAQNKYGKDFNVVTLFSDDSKKYLTTDLVSVEPVKDGFYSTDIKLISIEGKCVCAKRIEQRFADEKL